MLCLEYRYVSKEQEFDMDTQRYFNELQYYEKIFLNKILRLLLLLILLLFFFTNI